MPTTLHGLTLADLGHQGVLDKVLGYIHGAEKRHVITVNPEILVYASRHQNYLKVLQKADLLIPDGTGIILASYILGSRIKRGRVTGVSLAEKLISGSVFGGYSVFIIGASQVHLEKATLKLRSIYKNINISGSSVGPVFYPNAEFPLIDPVNTSVLEKIKQIQPDILLVAFGHPKQEYWLDYYMPELPIKVGIGIGGAVDFWAGVQMRSPQVFQSVGLEWLWRLIQEPRRWPRIFNATVVFSALVIKESISTLFHVEQKPRE